MVRSKLKSRLSGTETEENKVAGGSVSVPRTGDRSLSRRMQTLVRGWFKALVRAGVPRLKPRIVRKLPHDTLACTQGLAFNNGRIYESTGKPGQSGVRCLDPYNGQVLFLRPTPESDVWGEGIAVFDNRLIQLTWQHQKAFIYILPSLKLAGIINYQGEGWGLASDHGTLVMSNGSNRLTFRSNDLKVLSSVCVTLKGWPIRGLNDLEFIEGTVYANVWYSDEILAISARNGRVLAICDCRNLVRIEQPQKPECMLNGIAFNPMNGTFFVTGKYWSRMFEIEFVPYR